MHPGASSVALAALFSLVALDAGAETVIEAKLRALEPCSALRTNVAGLPVRVDKLRDLSVEAIDVTLRGDAVSMTVVGYLFCATSEAAMVRTDIGVRAKASSEVDLSSCRIAELRIDAVGFSGGLRDVAGALWPVVQPVLEAGAREQIAQACQDFKMAD